MPQEIFDPLMKFVLLPGVLLLIGFGIWYARKNAKQVAERDDSES